MKQTNMQKVRETAKAFLYLEPKVNKEFPILIDHPFFSSRVNMTRDGETFDIIENPDTYERLLEDFAKTIDKSDLARIFGMMLSKYHLAFLKFIKSYMSKRDFDEYLAYSWISTENPNKDKTVDISTLIKWFTAADKSVLMSETELELYNALPNEVVIYRGVLSGEMKDEKKALSWTCDYDTAKWFATRYGIQGYILKGKINKENVFAYFAARNEDEILCDSRKIFDVTRIEL